MAAVDGRPCKQLLMATEGKMVRGVTLSSRLYVPEVFSIEERESIDQL